VPCLASTAVSTARRHCSSLSLSLSTSAAHHQQALPPVLVVGFPFAFGSFSPTLYEARWMDRSVGGKMIMEHSVRAAGLIGWPFLFRGRNFLCSSMDVAV
jgi:hypothetical protein